MYKLLLIFISYFLNAQNIYVMNALRHGGLIRAVGGIWLPPH